MRFFAMVVLLIVLLPIHAPAIAGADGAVDKASRETPVRVVAQPYDGSFQSCLLGKPFQPFARISGFATPGSQYKLAVDPVTSCANCPTGSGFQVTVIDMLFETSVPCTIQVRADIERIAQPGDPGYDPACPNSSPGEVICQSGIVEVIFAGTGAQIASVVNPPCPCLPIDGPYLISIELLSSTCPPEPDVWVDGVPTICTSWYNDGTGWIDLVTGAGFPGNLRLSGDAECCTPLATEPKTWGAIKDLYDRSP